MYSMYLEILGTRYTVQMVLLKFESKENESRDFFRMVTRKIFNYIASKNKSSSEYSQVIEHFYQHFNLPCEAMRRVGIKWKNGNHIIIYEFSAVQNLCKECQYSFYLSTSKSLVS